MQHTKTFDDDMRDLSDKLDDLKGKYPELFAGTRPPPTMWRALERLGEAIQQRFADFAVSASEAAAMLGDSSNSVDEHMPLSQKAIRVAALLDLADSETLAAREAQVNVSHSRAGAILSDAIALAGECAEEDLVVARSLYDRAIALRRACDRFEEDCAGVDAAVREIYRDIGDRAIADLPARPDGEQI